MADYVCMIRTNYFHVKNSDTFREAMARAYGREGKLELREDKGDMGEPIFAFIVDGPIGGLHPEGYNPEADDGDSDGYEYNNFIDLLQCSVKEDDAVIIMEVGHEKFNYLCGFATIITSIGIAQVDLANSAIAQAKSILQNPKWYTLMDY